MHHKPGHPSLHRSLTLFVAAIMLASLLLAAVPPARAAAATTVEGTVLADVLNVRSGPSTAYPVINRVTLNTKLTLTGRDAKATWFQITLNGKAGWVSGQYTKTSGDPTPLPVVEVPPPPKPVAAQPVAAPRPSAPGFFGYGIQIDALRGDRGAAIGAVKNMGFNWVKFQLPWKDFEGSPGNYNWPDDVIDDLSNNGLSILVSIVKAPDWARRGDTDFSVEGPPENLQTYANFVGRFAERYCGRVQAIEVWNEQNIHYEWGNEAPDPARYVRLLAAAYNAIKLSCREMVVVSGALTPAGNVTIDGQWRAIDDQQYLKAMYRAGLARYSDAIGVHPSGYNVAPDIAWQQACAFINDQNSQFRGPCDSPHPSWSFLSTMQGYHNIMIANGDGRKRLWPTEFGWAAGGAFDPNYKYADDNTYEEQAAWTVRAYQLMRSWGYVGPAFLWNLNYRMTDNGSERAQWGILSPDGGGLPAYNALRDARNNGTLP